MPFELHTDEMLINMGPQHPATHGVLRLILRVDGEIVKQASPQIGYLHRCAEKIAEQLTLNQFIPYTDRMDYLGAVNNNLGFSLAAEKLLGLEVPKRAQYIRVLFCELSRIGSHQVAVGTYGIDLGAFTPFLYCWRDRELIMNIFEKMCGARLTHNFTRIGGIPNDISDEILDDIVKYCEGYGPKLDEIDNLLTMNRIFIERTANVGVISKEQCIEYGISGPNIRATGFDWDMRTRLPYSSYDEFDFDVVVGKAEHGVLGDCWNRYFVRMQEMRESIKIIMQAVEKIRQTEPGKENIRAATKKSIKLPKGEAFVRTETPRGELGIYIVGNGTDKPQRVKVRTPSFAVMGGFEEYTRDMMIADVVAVMGSIDIVLGDVDR